MTYIIDSESPTTKFRTIFISDIHLGTKSCKAKALLYFLTNNTCETLYLVGDIIDGWKVQQNKMVWKQSHTDVIRKILKLAKKKTTVIYIVGNHDEFLRPVLKCDLTFGKIKIINHETHVGLNNKKYLVTHGDLFDGITRLAPWISFLGDRSYDLLLSMNTRLNKFRHFFGLDYWSLSSYLKHRVKKAVDFIFQFEKNLAAHCKRKGFDGVICGHIHHAEIKNIDGIHYMNDGDWVESCTALVEHWSGEWEIITSTQEHDNNINNNG